MKVPSIGCQLPPAGEQHCYSTCIHSSSLKENANLTPASLQGAIGMGMQHVRVCMTG